MADAIQDHRASNENEPRNIYGKIVSEADRDLEFNIILTRVIQYSFDHYPLYTLEQHYERSYTHMKEKYGEGGYLKLWLDAQPNRDNLTEIRAVLADPVKFKSAFVSVCSEIF